jgi:hypothetical protein
MTSHDEELLAQNGWIVECENPFELWHEETNSKATGIAADLVLTSLKPKRTTCWCGQPIDTTNWDCISFNLCKDHASDS